MSFEPRSHFFAGLTGHLAGRPLLAVGSGTGTGRNLFTIKTTYGGRIHVTANIAPADDNRISVKLTIDREVKGGPTLVFSEIEKRHRKLNGLFGQRISWEHNSGDLESKVEVARFLPTLSAAAIDAEFAWVERNACILLEWAIEAGGI
jgi:hypothetical protein